MKKEKGREKPIRKAAGGKEWFKENQDQIPGFQHRGEGEKGKQAKIKKKKRLATGKIVCKKRNCWGEARSRETLPKHPGKMRKTQKGSHWGCRILGEGFQKNHRGVARGKKKEKLPRYQMVEKVRTSVGGENVWGGFVNIEFVKGTKGRD